MDLEWDAAKAAQNLKKHGVSFEDAELVFYDGGRIETYDGRQDWHMPPALFLLDPSSLLAHHPGLATGLQIVAVGCGLLGQALGAARRRGGHAGSDRARDDRVTRGAAAVRRSRPFGTKAGFGFTSSS